MPLTAETQSRMRFALASNPAGEELIKAVNLPVFDNTNSVYTAAGNFVMASGQMGAAINKTVGAATQVTLPPAPAAWQLAIVTDAKGDAATNNITIVPAAGTIDGAASVVIAANYGDMIFLYNGTEWNVVSNNALSGGGTLTITTALVGGVTPFPITGQGPLTPTAAGGSVAIAGGIGGATSGTGGAVSLTSGTAAAAAASGTSTISTGAGTASTAAINAGTSGTTTISTGAGGAAAGSGTGGAAGTLAFTGGAGGNTATGTVAGAGAGITITGGAGGAATAGTGAGGAGGNVNLVPGALGTSAGGTVGVVGEIQFNGNSGVYLHTWQYIVPPTSFVGTFFTAVRAVQVKGITARVDVAGTDGSAVTATFFKCPSGTAVGSGSALHSGTFNLKGTANANQTLTLTGTLAALKLAAGDSIGVVITGIPTSAVGSVTLSLTPN